MSKANCVNKKNKLNNAADKADFDKRYKEFREVGIPAEEAFTQAAEVIMEQILVERNELAAEVREQGGYLEDVSLEQLLAPEQDGRTKALNEGGNEKIIFEVGGYKDDFGIYNKDDREQRFLIDGFDGIEDAEKYLKENYDDLVNSWEAVMHGRHVERKITTKEDDSVSQLNLSIATDLKLFNDTFGFKSLVFDGGQPFQHKKAIKDVSSALMDLSKILGVEPRAMSLNGELSLVFEEYTGFNDGLYGGKKNTGGEITMPFGFHYRALAHEFFHGLDYYFQRKRRGFEDTSDGYIEIVDFITSQSEKITQKKDSALLAKETKLGDKRKVHANEVTDKEENGGVDEDLNEGVRPEVADKFIELVNALNRSPQRERSKLLDDEEYEQTGEGRYFSLIIERAARSFENYVVNEIKLMGVDDGPWLKTFIVDGDNQTSYLKPEELPDIKQAFDELFETIETKETDSGVAMFEDRADYDIAKEDNDDYSDSHGNDKRNENKSKSVGSGTRERDHNRRQRALSGEMLALGISEEIETKGSAVAIGRTITNYEQLADLAQAFRNPRYETLRYYFTKNDKIIHATGFSQRLPGSASAFPQGISGKDGHLWIQAQMEKTGADGFWLSHNHPSGLPVPSQQDIKLTQGIAQSVDGFLGHVIINSNKYGTIDAQGQTQVWNRNFGDDTLLTPSKKSVFLNKKIDSPDVLANLGKSLQKDGFVVLVGVSGKSGVRAIMEIDAPLMADKLRARKAVKDFSSHSGSGQVFMVGARSDFNESSVNYLIEKGYLIDAVTDNKFSFLQKGNVSVDQSLFMGKKSDDNDIYVEERSDKKEYQKPKKSISIKETHAILNDLAPLLTSNIGRTRSVSDVIVTPDFASMPDAIKQEAQKQGSDGSDVYGVFHKGKIYLIQTKMANRKTVEKTLYHEATHKGLKEILGDKKTAYAMNKLMMAIGGSKRFNQLADDLGVDLSAYEEGVNQKHDDVQGITNVAVAGRPKSDDGSYKFTKSQREHILIEELLAHIGERGSKGLKQKALDLLGALRNWLRKHGFMKLAELGASDLSFIAKSARENGLKNKGAKRDDIRFMFENMANPKQASVVLDGGLEFDVSFSKDADNNPWLDELKKLAELEEPIILEGDAQQDGINYAHEKSVFLSSLPERTIYRADSTRTAQAIRFASNMATKDIAGNGSDTPRISKSSIGKLGLFTSRAKVYSFNDYEALHVQFDAKELTLNGKNNSPALTIIVEKDGELTIHGPAISSDAFKWLEEKGMASAALDANGVIAVGGLDLQGFTRLNGVTRKQLIAILGDVHARTKLWKNRDKVGLKWKRATGAKGGTEQDGTAVFFSREAPNKPTIYSKSAQDISEKMADVLGGVDISAKARRFGLFVLTNNQIGEVFSKVFKKFAHNPVNRFVSKMQDFEGELARRMRAADKTKQKWDGLSLEENKKISKLMSYSTFYGVDLSKSFNEESVKDDYERNIAALKKKIKGIKVVTPSKHGGQGLSMDSQGRVQELEGRIKQLKERITGLSQQKFHYGVLSKQFNALSDDAKSLYSEVRDAYKTQFNEQIEALKERVARTIADEVKRNELLADIDLKFRPLSKNDVYFPLQRWGDHFVVYKKGKEFIRLHYDTGKQARAAIKEMKKDGWEGEYDRATEKLGSAMEVPEFAQNVINALDEKGATLYGNMNAGVSIRDEINQLLLKAAPEVSYLKRNIHRKYIAGFSEDQKRAFAHNMFHGSYRIAKIKHGDLLAQEIKHIGDYRHDKKMDLEDQERAADIENELKKRFDLSMNPTGNSFSAGVTQFGFINYLGASLGAGLVNTMQTPLFTAPYLMSKYGIKNTTRELSKALEDFIVHSDKKVNLIDPLMSLEKSLHIKPNERKMLAKLINDGTIDTTQVSSLAQLSETDTLKVQSTVVEKTMRAVGYVFHNAEILNRQVSALAAYRLHFNKTGDHHASVAAAKQTVNDTHFDYSSHNRARFMRGNAAKMLLVFKNYSQQATYFILSNGIKAAKGDKQAQKLVAYATLMHLALAGVSGLPIYGAVKLVVEIMDELFDDGADDEEMEYKKWLRDLAKSAGAQNPERVQQIINKGLVNGLLGIDLNARISSDVLRFWINQDDLGERDPFHDAMIQATGPIGSYVFKNLDRVRNKALDGEFLDAATAAVPVKGIRDLMKAYQLGTDGLQTYRGDDIISKDDVSPYEIAMQAAGLSPAKKTEHYEKIFSEIKTDRNIRNLAKKLNNRYQKAVIGKDLRARRDVLKDVKAFIKKYPRYAFNPNRSLKARLRNSAKNDRGIVINKRNFQRIKDSPIYLD